jgi:hypothetical protein
MMMDANQKLIEAAKQGDIGGIRAALAEGATYLQTAFQQAAFADQAVAASYLMDQGAICNRRSSYEEDMLFNVFQNDNFAVFKMLIERDVFVNDCLDEFINQSYKKSIIDHEEKCNCVKLLLKKVNITKYILARTVIQAMNKNGNPDFYKIMLECGGQELINSGEALMGLIKEIYYGEDKNEMKAIEQLVLDGADVHIQNERPLLQSIVHGSSGATDTLLWLGADINVIIDPNKEWKAGYIGARSGLSMYEYNKIIYPKCDILTWVIWAGYFKHSDSHLVNSTRVLLKHGANVHAFDDLPIREAAKSLWTCCNVARLLVEAGADLNVLEPEQRALVQEVCAEGPRAWDEYSYHKRRYT